MSFFLALLYKLVSHRLVYSFLLLSFQNAIDTAVTPVIKPEHDLPMGSWSDEQIRSATAASTMLTWMPGKAKHGLPILARGEGVYVYDTAGKQYLDWTSQAVCSNIGYDMPTAVIDAVTQQMQVLPFAYGGLSICEIRARLSALISDILPGDLQGMVFPSSGAEANEAAIMMARRYTGKTKVLNWYRSYHGGTANTLQATGDFRRWYGGDMVPGFVKVHNPFPLFFEYGGTTEAEQTQMALNMLEEQVLAEGPDTIAMISFESIVGSGGVLVPPEGFMQGVRAICDKYHIVMHLDEVMCGFGRTGKMFGFQNFDGVLPDIISCAKGITSSAMPMSMTACRQHIMDFFEEKPIGWGSTYQVSGCANRQKGCFFVCIFLKWTLFTHSRLLVLRIFPYRLTPSPWRVRTSKSSTSSRMTLLDTWLNWRPSWKKT